MAADECHLARPSRYLPDLSMPRSAQGTPGGSRYGWVVAGVALGALSSGCGPADTGGAQVSVPSFSGQLFSGLLHAADCRFKYSV